MVIEFSKKLKESTSWYATKNYRKWYRYSTYFIWLSAISLAGPGHALFNGQFFFDLKVVKVHAPNLKLSENRFSQVKYGQDIMNSVLHVRLKKPNSIYKGSKFLDTRSLIRSCLVWAELECSVHVTCCSDQSGHKLIQTSSAKQTTGAKSLLFICMYIMWKNPRKQTR